MNTLQIENLTKRYANGVLALNNVSLTLKDGMFGLLGANGAGKSSLMRTIASLQKPSSGTIYFNQKDIVKHPNNIRNCLGYLPQEFGVYPKVSAQELLEHLAVLKGVINVKERRKQVESLLYQTNLYQHSKKAVATFSGGMKQRFGIAQALLGDPKVILVDEPTAGLDPEERNRFLNLLSEIGEHVIVILSTHLVDDVYDLCTQMAIFDQGQIILKGKPQELVKTLEGKVWSKLITKEELISYKEQYKVIATKLIAGQTQITVLSDENPEKGFSPKKANLEDLYFSQTQL